MPRTTLITLSLLTPLVALSPLADAALAPLSNIAPSGTPTMGYATDVAETEFATSGHPASLINDGSLTTGVATTYNGEEFAGGDNDAPYDYVGLTWATPQSGIVSLTIHHWLYTDGGWFGTGPSLVNFWQHDTATPAVQVFDGTTWTDVNGVTSNYLAAFAGEIPAAGSNTSNAASPAYFDFAAQNRIYGIRLYGYGGGRSFYGQDAQGFIALTELEVGQVPLPAAAWLFGGALLGLAGLRRRR